MGFESRKKGEEEERALAKDSLALEGAGVCVFMRFLEDKLHYDKSRIVVSVKQGASSKEHDEGKAGNMLCSGSYEH